MSIEIDVLNGDESWSLAEGLFERVWPPEAVRELSWGHIKWADADLRVMIEAPDGVAGSGGRRSESVVRTPGPGCGPGS